MARKHHYRRRAKGAVDLDVTTFLNLMVALVPFLLITAVFSRIAIVELNLPSTASGPEVTPPEFRLEVIVREGGLEIGNGKTVIAALPKEKDGEYDLATLSKYMVSLKEDYPQNEAASVLLEPSIPYDYLIQVMDVVRSVAVPAEPDIEVPAEPGKPNPQPQQLVQLALFPDISVGDAP
jgi:biopolymer transport protein ExbD